MHNREKVFGVADLVGLLRQLFSWFALAAGQLLGLLLLVTAVVWSIAIWAPSTVRVPILLGAQALLLFNAFAPHITLTLRARRYTPGGVVSAVLLVIPVSAYLFVQIIAGGA